MAARHLMGTLFLSLSLPGWAQGGEMAVGVLIEALQRQGHTILYSDRQLRPRQPVTVDEISLPALRAALAEHQLTLQARDGVWVVVRAPAPVPPQAYSPPQGKDLPLETVIVTGSLHQLPHGSRLGTVHSYYSDDLSAVPSLASDAMRATLRLPGVSSVGISAKPRIRGGLQDELLVLQDGIELLEPFHLADYHSAYSTIDYRTIESLDVYTGGFPSRYGNRISGVMDIRNLWQDDSYDTDIGVSSFSNFIHTRGQLGEARPVNWLLSLRQGDLTDLTDYIETRAGKPEYHDASARVNAVLSEAISLAAGAAYAADDIRFEDEEETASARLDTRYLWSSLDWHPAAPVHSRLTLSHINSQRKKQLQSFEDEEKGGLLDHRQEVNRLALRNDWWIIRDNRLWEFGWQAEYSEADYNHISLIDRGELADLLDTPRDIAQAIRERPAGWSGGAYLQLEWDLNESLTVQPSLRWDTQDYYIDRGMDHQLSPRLGLAYQWDEATRLRLSLGRFRQPEGVQELQVLDGITRFYRPQYADQLVAGIDRTRGDLELVAEVYYKRYGNLKERFENMFNPFVLLPEMEPDRVGLGPDRAVARGFDLELSQRLHGQLRGSVRYSYMDARDRFQGHWVDRRWSQRHTVNAGLNWRRGSFGAGLALTWHSGWRSSLLPNFVSEDTTIAVASVLNNTELRNYLSLDINLHKSWEIGRARLLLYADISNLTDRRNEAGIDFDVEEVEGGYVILPDHETLLGRIPSVGLTLSF